jgi:hypothetical protein
MYVLLVSMLVLLAVFLILRGVRKKRRVFFGLGLALGLVTFGFFSFLCFWGEAPWFDAVGYAGRFWKTLGYQVSLSAVEAVVGFTLVFLLSLPALKSKPKAALLPAIGGFLGGGIWGWRGFSAKKSPRRARWEVPGCRTSGKASDPSLRGLSRPSFPRGVSNGRERPSKSCPWPWPV